MKSLPVPPLRQTLDRYLAAVRPVSTDEEFAATAAAVERWAAGDGPACQRALEEFAETEATAWRSWLSEAWLEGYLNVRDPLPLATSVGFLVNWPTEATGLDRAADFLHRMAAVHLAYLRGDLPAERSARGDELDSAQRGYLTGGTRVPGAGVDTVETGPGHPGSREMVVLWRGVPYAVPVSDGDGQPLSRTALRQALGTIMASGEARDDFAELSYVGSEDLARLLPAVLAHADNEATYARLSGALFGVNLTDEAVDEDTFLSRATVGLGQAWAYKPATYQINVHEDLIAVHVEHSTYDGATLKNVIGLAQQQSPDDVPGVPAPVEGLSWVLPADLADEVAHLLKRYSVRAGALRVRTVSVPVAVPELPFRVSADAVAQLLMAYAQWATYGELRSTYEAVDMREYTAGRTECLRPNTAAARALVQALAEDRAGAGELDAALAAHKSWVIACKSGQAIDRHLFGLQLMAERHGLEATVQTEDGYRRLTTDFLSTTSLGDPHQIVRFAFAPTSAGGIGISYGANGDVHEFCLNYGADRDADIDAFVAHLADGGRRLEELLIRIAG